LYIIKNVTFYETNFDEQETFESIKI